MENPNEDKAKYAVKTTWDGQLRAITAAELFVLGGEVHARPFEVVADEPPQLLGSNHGPNPQELLFAAHRNARAFTALNICGHGS